MNKALCPFTIIIDTREQNPYTFTNIRAGADKKHVPIEVPTTRLTLSTGDYSIFGLPSITIERKSAADLYSSMVRRRNFEQRLARMSELRYAAVVVEAEWSELLWRPPSFSRYPAKSLSRTIQAWTIRYPTVHWWTMPGRDAAEMLVYRLLERFYVIHQREQKEAGILSDFDSNSNPEANFARTTQKPRTLVPSNPRNPESANQDEPPCLITPMPAAHEGVNGHMGGEPDIIR